MKHHLTPEGYAQTKEKLEVLRVRLDAIRHRTDLAPTLRYEAVRSCEDVMQQYTKEMKLFESAHLQAFELGGDRNLASVSGESRRQSSVMIPTSEDSDHVGFDHIDDPMFGIDPPRPAAR